MRLSTLTLVALLLVGCTQTGDTVKQNNFAEGSINFHPLPYPVTAIETEAGDTEYVYVMPDGSQMTVSDMGVYGNFTLSTNQNDTHDARTDAQVDAKVDATVTPGAP